MANDHKVLLYLFRRDLRVTDNPILDRLATTTDHGFTHLLPMYVFPAQQIEVSGFITDDAAKNPYPIARSPVGSFWRCGPHRAKYTAESVWDLKTELERIGSGLCLRVGMAGEVVQKLLAAKDCQIRAVWMTSEEGVEEKREERDIRKACDAARVGFKLWRDEKYLIDDDDIPFKDAHDLPDVFTTYRKMVEPLREQPRPVLPIPKKGTLPPMPETTPPQHEPFSIPSGYSGLEEALLKPISKPQIDNPPSYPRSTESAHPFKGGETHARQRLENLVANGSMTKYKATRNGLLGTDFSTKLSAYLALGSLTARQIHAALKAFEDGTNDAWKGTHGYGKGENDGTKAVRFELLWRDYMRLCTRKFGAKLFRLSGFREDEEAAERWRRQQQGGSGGSSHGSRTDPATALRRFLNGTTGMGLIDASQRELYHTGYTSNRARQNVASFLAKHLYLDWRLGAEWYESQLVDYDVSSNWGNWQYVAGVGNDPRGESRVFNPVKQASDYDRRGEYIMAWVDELRPVGAEVPTELYQPSTMPWEKQRDLGLLGQPMIVEPLKQINFYIRRGDFGGGGRGRGGRRGGGRGGRGGGGGGGGDNHQRGGGRGGGGGGGSGHRGSTDTRNRGRGGHNDRSGPMDKARATTMQGEDMG